MIRIALLILMLAHLSGCSTLGAKLHAWLNGEPKTEEGPETNGGDEHSPKFSENPNIYSPVERQYRKMTQQRLEEEAEVHSQAGSLWSMEGQSSYLFSQNTSRQEGDLLNVEVTGAALNQLATKVDVIKSLLARIEEQEKVAERGLASVPPGEATPAKAEGIVAPNPPTPVAQTQNAKAPGAAEESALPVKTVPTRIVERLSDGNYRVKGSQPFMIGKDQYKVIVTGIVRPEDFNDEGISTDKLLDPQYDVVSLRRVVQ